MLDIDVVRKATPRSLKKRVTPELIDEMNAISSDPMMGSIIKENLLGYISVLQDGRFKLEDYIHAVKYCAFKSSGDTNIAAFVKTYPDRYASYVASGTSQKDIASYVTSYNKNKLVTEILKQAMIPVWLLNADVMQKAINTQSMIMGNEDASYKVRSDAANSIMTHLKRPEAAQIEIDVTSKGDGLMDELNATMRKMAQQQQELLSVGVAAKEIAQQGILIEYDN